MKNNNSASRLHRTMSGWRGMRDGDPAVRGWSNILRLDHAGEREGFRLVAHKIDLLNDELEVLRDGLRSKGLSESIYQPPLVKLESALSLPVVMQQSVHVKQHLTEDVYLGLAIFSEVLPHEEDEIGEEEFREVVAIIHDLELLLLSNSLPSSLTALIRRHVRSAEMALAQYPIRGAASLKDAARFALGDFLLESEAIKGGLSQADASKLAGLWRRMNALADGAIKVDNLLQLGGKVLKVLDDFSGS